MKRNPPSIFAAVILTVLATLACSLFTGTPDAPTREAEPYFGPTSGPLAFEPASLSLPEAKAGAAYETRIQITQNTTPVGDISISNGALPAGLEFEFIDGEDAALIHGTPQEAGTFTFTISVWCFGTQVSGQSGEKDYELKVGP